MSLIYLDHNATTPLDPEVHAELEATRHVYGNPSSLHAAGREARLVLDRARERVARLIGATPDEIVFTSGGTEADNLALFGGAAAAARTNRRHVVVSAIEHHAVLHPADQLQATGHCLTLAPVDPNGVVRLEALADIVQDDPALVSVMLANNDTGVIQPVAEVAALAHASGALAHSDAVQAAGKVAIDVQALGVDFLSLSSHKLHGPRGAGALYVRRGTRLQALLFGGRQERGLRPGTENVAALAGFGKACELAAARLEADAAHVAALRDAFEAGLLAAVPGAVVVGAQAPRLPNTSYVHFPGRDATALVIQLDLRGVAASTGAACSSLDNEPSRVLVAMGYAPEDARSAVRFSFGRGSTQADVTTALRLLVEAGAAPAGGLPR